LLTALTRVDLAGALKADGPFTVFAPTDAAFGSLLSELGATSLDDIDDETLTSVLLYHVEMGELFPSPIVGNGTISPLHGQVITVRDERSSVSLTDVNGREANVLDDVGASNGAVHVVNRVVLPSLC
jgi:transforming growth factor-beta-induced protein